MSNSSGGHFPEVLLIHSKWLLYGFITDSFAVISSPRACQCLSVSSIKLDSCKSGNITFTLVSHPLFSHAAPLTLPGLMSVAYAGVESSRLNHLAL